MRILLGEAWRGLRSEPAAALLSVIVVGLALYIPAMLYLSARTGDRFGRQIRAQVKMRAYLQEDADGPFDELVRQIETLPQVRLAVYRDRSDLLAELEAELGEGLLDGLPGNPLPRAIDVRLKPESATELGLDSLARVLQVLPGVDDVVYGRVWAHRADRFLGQVRYFLGIVIVALALLVLAITSNIIRLIIRNRREAIGVWLLMGASPLYARVPYYIEGGLAGLAGAIVTLVLLYVSHWWLHQYVPLFEFFTVTETVIFIALAVVMAVFGAILAARRKILAL